MYTLQILSDIHTNTRSNTYTHTHALAQYSMGLVQIYAMNYNEYNEIRILTVCFIFLMSLFCVCKMLTSIIKINTDPFAGKILETFGGNAGT